MLPLADVAPDGHVHRSRLQRGTRIPAHLHPDAVEYMLVLEGVVETTGGRRCEKATSGRHRLPSSTART